MYEIGVQMVEIYNEQVRDLLSSDSSQKKYPSLFIFILWHKDVKRISFSIHFHLLFSL